MSPRSFARRAAVALMVALALAGCSSGGSGTAPAVPAKLGIVTEPPTAAASGVPLSPQPAVQVLDASGNPLSSRGILVTVSLASGSGTLSGETGVRTDAGGRATFTDLAISGSAGARTLRFSSTGLSAALAREIQLGPGPATTASVTAGNNQTAPAGTALPGALSIRVADQSDNPVPGVQVTFAVTGGGGSIEGATTATNAEGRATLERWTLGPAVGTNTLSATVAGLSGPPLTITATGVVGPAAVLSIVEGDGQSATIGAAVTTNPAVKVADAFGNVVAGVAVTFAVASGGGSVSSATGISDAQGIARASGWRLGLVPGANTLTASRQGAASVSFTATGLDFPVAAIAAGNAHTCSATAAGPRCWGDNSGGQFGNGTTVSDSVPVAANGSLVFTQVASGAGYSCGLTATGAAWCWGVNSTGQLGDGTGTSRSSPVAVIGGYTFRQLVAGNAHTCGLRTDGALFCWGSNGNGRLGNGTTSPTATPNAVAGGYTWTSVSAGAAHTCAVRNDAALYCWGANANGRLGDGTTQDRSVPTAVSGGQSWSAVAAGGSHTCALGASGAAFCWGNGSSGQLGTGTTTGQTAPAAVTGSQTFTTIAAGGTHTCALATGGAAWCWGANGSGRLGDGTVTQRLVPTLVTGGVTYAAISLGAEHTCAVSSVGSAICWGRNAEGELGDGSTTARPAPVGVKQP